MQNPILAKIRRQALQAQLRNIKDPVVQKYIKTICDSMHSIVNHNQDIFTVILNKFEDLMFENQILRERIGNLENPNK